MRKYLLLMTVAAAAMLAAGIAVQAQPYGPGMVGGGQGQSQDQNQNQNQNQGQGQGQGQGRNQGYGMMGGGYGPGMMGGYGQRYHGGPGNYSGQVNVNLSTDAVKNYFERMIADQGNPRLKVGDVKEKDADTIVADIVTKDNSLVQRFAVNRHNGFYRPEEN